jgi:hypothetical protein
MSPFAEFLRTLLQQTMRVGCVQVTTITDIMKLVNTYKSHVFGTCNMDEYMDVCKVLIKI